MSNGQVQAAIAALLTVGVLLLNLGSDVIKTDLRAGLIIIAAGVALIVVAVLLIRFLAEKIIDAKYG